MRKLALMFSGIVFFFFVTSCSPSKNLRIVNSEIKFDISNQIEFTQDSLIRVDKKLVNLENASLRHVDYFSEQNVLFLHYSDPKEKRYLKKYVTYLDLNNPQSNWSFKPNSDFIPTIKMINKDVVKIGLNLYKTENGDLFDPFKKLRDYSNEQQKKSMSDNDSINYVINSLTTRTNHSQDHDKYSDSEKIGDETLIFTKDKFSLYNNNSNKIIWQKLSHNWEGILYYRIVEDWVIAYADGIDVFKYKNGKGWYKKLNLQEPIRIPRSFYDKLFSPPILINEHVYIVTKHSILCLNKETGDIIWETTLEHDLGRTGLTITKGGNLLFFSFGYSIKEGAFNQKLDSKYMPFMISLSLDNGSILSSINFDPKDFFYEWKKFSDFILLAGPEQILAINEDLQITANYKIDDIGEYLRFIEPDDNNLYFSQHGMGLLSDKFVNKDVDSPIYVRTTEGLLCLSLPTLKKNWYYNIKSPYLHGKEKHSIRLIKTYFPSIAQIYMQLVDLTKSRITKNIFWFVDDKEGLIGLNTTNGIQVVYKLPIKGENYFFNDNNEFVLFQEKDKVEILKFNEN